MWTTSIKSRSIESNAKYTVLAKTELGEEVTIGCSFVEKALGGVFLWQIIMPSVCGLVFVFRYFLCVVVFFFSKDFFQPLRPLSFSKLTYSREFTWK